MNNDIANLSSDLKRISYWILDDRVDLVKRFLEIAKEKYKSIDEKIGGYNNIWEEIEKIENLEGGNERAAERALTASVILLHSVCDPSGNRTHDFRDESPTS